MPRICTVVLYHKYINTYFVPINIINTKMAYGVCSVCLREFSVTARDVIRIHGPTSYLCQGSGCPPCQLVRTSATISSPGGEAPPPSTPHGPSWAFDLTTTAQVRTLNRIPKEARVQSSLKLVNILDQVVQDNSPSAWECLLLFPSRCLWVPGRDHSGKLLSALIKQQLTEEQDPLPKQFRHSGGDR